MKAFRLVATLLLLGIFMTAASAQLGGNLTVNDSEGATVTVNISSKVMVDITPSVFSWAAVDPGSVADDTDEASGYFAIQIENIGSANITHVWFNASYPMSTPFGTGVATAVDAGNFIVLSKNSTKGNNADYWFINRVEYEAVQELVYLKDPLGNMPPDNTSYTYGRLHNASNEYFWMIDAVADCDTPGTVISIGNSAHSKTQTGTTDFGGSGVYNFTLADNGAGFGYADIDAGVLNGLCVAVDNTCTRVFFSKWNADEPFDNCANVNYAYDDAVEGGPLVPGDSFAMGIKAFVPYGIVEGSSSGTITAIVNTA